MRETRGEAALSAKDMGLGVDPLFLRGPALREAADLAMRSGRALDAATAPALVDADLGWPHFRALALLAQRGGLGVNAAAAELGVTKQSLAPVLRLLTERGLVRRDKNPNDRRSRRLTLTPAGDETLRAIVAPQAEALARAFRKAGPAAVEGYRAVCAALAESDRPSHG